MKVAMAVLCFLLGLGLQFPSFAQRYPAKPVKIIVPYPPGGPVDILGRTMGAKLQEVWKQSVVVENKPGASTIIGTEAVVKASPDGYTIGLINTPIVINPGLYSKLPYDTVKDIAGISLLTINHIVLVANRSLQANNVAEVIELATKLPGKLRFASRGSGTSIHLAGALLNSRAKISLVHVPYKGMVPAQQDLLAGRVDLMFDVLQSALPQVQAGKLKVIAVASQKRTEFAPQYPVISETIPDFSVPSIMGLIAPRATPREVVRRIHSDAVASMKTPELSERIRKLYMDPVASSPEEFDNFIRTEIVKWAEVVKASGATVD